MVASHLPIAASRLWSRCSKTGETEGVRPDLYRMRTHSTTARLDKTTLAINAASADIQDISELEYLPCGLYHTEHRLSRQSIVNVDIQSAIVNKQRRLRS